MLVLCRWDDLVLQPCKLLMPVLLDLINQSRQGDRVDWNVLAGVISSFVTIGSATNTEQPVQLYTDTFEGEFLKRTHQFYKKASQKFLSVSTHLVSPQLQIVSPQYTSSPPVACDA